MPSIELAVMTRRAFMRCLPCLPGALAAPALCQASGADAALAPMLASDAPPGIDPQGFLVSEKYDGVRALWDGRRLRFRSGADIAAPAWFLARLPATPLDGELWLARGGFEVLVGTVRKLRPVDAEWARVRYMVFDLPRAAGAFAERSHRLLELFGSTRTSGARGWEPVEQATLSSRPALQRRLSEVLAAGGEGLMLHRADAQYRGGRSGALLKLKPLADAEALVVGHQPGQSRHAGRLGALRVRMDDGREFMLGTGFSDAQRAAPPPPGATVTYTHRGLTAQGLPRFASFQRVRELP